LAPGRPDAHRRDASRRCERALRAGRLAYYFNEIASLPLAAGATVDQAIHDLVEQGFAVIGTPDDAVAQLERLQEQSGGFGTFLHMATNWASFDNTKKSYELFSRYVMPKFQARNEGRKLTVELAQKNRPELFQPHGGAIQRVREARCRAGREDGG
jgi:limonene 1,2-monooxygenase